MRQQSDECLRLFRIENTARQRCRPVEGLSGRWFSDDPKYLEDNYTSDYTHWTYVDVPKELAESFRYENISKTDGGRHLYGVEHKDFILPEEWANKRTQIPRPDEYFVEGPKAQFEVSEITSNVAVVGRVLWYDRESQDITVVESISGDEAVLLTKNRIRNRDTYTRRVVPIRRIKRM